jgi:hypothetical protein
MMNRKPQKFTNTLLALYAQRQMIKLDAPLQNYVPPSITVPKFGAKQITSMLELLRTGSSNRPSPLAGNRPVRSAAAT